MTFIVNEAVLYEAARDISVTAFYIYPVVTLKGRKSFKQDLLMLLSSRELLSK